MAEYIEREALEVALNYRLNSLMAENGEYDHYTSGFDEAVTRVEAFPASDVAPVWHGRWERVIQSKSAAKWSTKVSCSNCHSAGYTRYKYCPNCGCRMDG